MTTSIQSTATQTVIGAGGNASALVVDATGIVLGADGGIKPVTASVAASALTVGINPCTTQFRSTTLTGAGLPVQLSNAAALSLVVPSGATLGTVSAVASTIVILEINNAGTKELAVVNLAGGNDLTETGLINTTVMSAASDSANVIYSETARTGVAYRVVGSVVSTQTTAGTWAQALEVTGEGGQALAAMSSLGYGQSVTATGRGLGSVGTTFYNTTGKPMVVSIGYTTAATAASSLSLYVNGVRMYDGSGGNGTVGSVSGIVPAGWSYSTVNLSTAVVSINSWNELR